MILAGDHADADAAVRFLAEAEAVARLQHPNIVQIYEVGEDDGLPFFALEYVDGRQPGPAARRHPLAGAAGGDAGRDAGPAVAEAHRRGIVHRDLKPANILLAADGDAQGHRLRPGQGLDAEAGLTATESILGTPSYMAPEQAEGKARQVGPAADVYALGAILYELLTGRPPFRGATALETLEQVRRPSRCRRAAGAGRCRATWRRSPEVPAEGPGPALRVGRGAGRGPAAVPGGRADPGAAGGAGGAGLAVVPAEPGRGGPDGGRGRAAGRRRPVGATVAAVRSSVSMAQAEAKAKQELEARPVLPAHRPGPPRAAGGQPGPGRRTARRVPGRPAAAGNGTTSSACATSTG